jgi:hypothetical protein
MSDNSYFNGITLLEPGKDESDEFSLYNIPTQQLVFQKQQTNNRFAEPVSESQINQMIKDRVPRIRRKTIPGHLKWCHTLQVKFDLLV